MENFLGEMEINLREIKRREKFLMDRNIFKVVSASKKGSKAPHKDCKQTSENLSKSLIPIIAS
jgi:hypothetical protein